VVKTGNLMIMPQRWVICRQEIAHFRTSVLAPVRHAVGLVADGDGSGGAVSAGMEGRYGPSAPRRTPPRAEKGDVGRFV
jgi:hypothetical protein